MELSISPRARIIAAAAVVVTLAVGSSFALFSDTGTVRSTFSSGTLDLKFDDDQDGNPDPYVVTFDGGDVLAAGTVVSAELVVFNSGTIDATLDLGTPVIENAAVGPELLQDEITLVITDTGTATELYSGPLTTAAFSGLDLGSNGTTATGTTLEFELTVAADAGVGVAGQTLQVDFPFTATQSTP